MNPFEGKHQPLGEFDPRSKEDQTRNKSIAQRIDSILCSKKYKWPKSFEKDSVSATFHDPNNDPETIIALDAGWNKTLKTGYYADAPKKFSFPCYIFQVWSYSTPIEVATPYGVLPGKIIGADNSVYFFDNIYFFNKKGEATKYEQIVGPGFERDDDNNLRKIEITPSEKDSRYVPMDQEDYGKIENALNRIEAGKLIESNPF